MDRTRMGALGRLASKRLFLCRWIFSMSNRIAHKNSDMRELGINARLYSITGSSLVLSWTRARKYGNHSWSRLRCLWKSLVKINCAGWLHCVFVLSCPHKKGPKKAWIAQISHFHPLSHRSVFLCGSLVLNRSTYLHKNKRFDENFPNAPIRIRSNSLGAIVATDKCWIF